MAIMHSSLVLSLLLASFASCVTVLPKTTPETSTSNSSNTSIPNSSNKKYIGAAINVTALTTDKKYRSIVTKDFSVLTAENEMKWDYMEREPQHLNLTAADTLNKFIEETGKKLRFHTILANTQNPTWINGLDKEKMQKAAYDHLELAFSNYSKNMIAMDVCNEILDEGALRQTVWLKTWGPEFIEDIHTKARELANKYNPDVKLFINDYSIEGVNAKSNKMLELATSLHDKGVVDAVGFQSHLQVGKVPKDFKTNLERFTKAGLLVALTELDIRIQLKGRSPEDIEKDRQQQTLDFQEAFDVCAQVDGCLGVTLWGVTDSYSWIPKTSSTSDAGEALLIDQDYKDKAAFEKIKAKYFAKSKAKTRSKC